MSDTKLKLRIRTVLWAQGYHCPIEVDLSDYQFEEQGKTLRRDSLTDIDVLGIRIEPDLRISTIVADCKSGKESEPNRVFWLRGVVDFFGAQEGILVKTTFRLPARSLAPKLGIRVLDESGLERLEQSLDLTTINVDIGNPLIAAQMQNLWGIQVPKGGTPTEDQLTLKFVYQYLQYEYWMNEEYRNIQTLVERFAEVSDLLHHSDDRARYLAYIGLQRLTLSILRTASDITSRSIVDIRRQSRIYLFGGPRMLRDRSEMMDKLNQFMEQQRIPGGGLSLAPAYFDELVEIVNRLINGSRYASRLLQHLDAVLFDHVFGTKRSLEEILGTQYSTDALVLTKRIANMLITYANLDKKIFLDLLDL